MSPFLRGPVVRTEPLDQIHYFFRGHSDQTIRLVAEFDGAAREDELREALAQAVKDASILRYRYEERADRAVWVEAPLPDPASYFSVETLASDSLEARLAELLPDQESPFAVPPLGARLLRHARGDVLVLSMDHTHTDGAGFKLFVQHLFGLYARTGSAPPWTTERRDAALATAAVPWAQRLALLRPQTPKDARLAWTFPWDEGTDRGEGRIHTMWLGAETLPGLRAYARARDATINDVMLAAYFRALSPLISATGAERPVVDVPVDLRKHVKPPVRVGLSNFTGLIRCALGGDPAEGFDATVARTKAAMDAAKASHAEFGVVIPLVVFRPLLKYAALREQVRTHARPFAPVWSNLGILDLTPFRRAGVRTLRILGSMSLRGPVSVQACTVDGRLHFASGAWGTAGDHARVEALLDGLRRELESSAQRTERSPQEPAQRGPRIESALRSEP